MMQTSVQRALPASAVLSALLPGLFVSQTRSKVFTSNVMDETRAKRIKDHFTYMHARVKYRKDLFRILQSWRAEIKAKQLDEEAVARQRKAQELRDEATRMQDQLKERQALQLREEVRKAELEHKRAQIQLQRAHRRQEELQKREQEQAERYQRLLAASRNWIRQEEFEAAIHRALDNPQPFGFITNLPVSKGF
ncbi:hypothetical protein PLESTB_000278000 [Pleodorina starrii]|uniref:Uncharacterized protein n=1 Tax=Pleodorina starrii TaxID=330485 RepID=A0A9W6BCN6_9CHLO|nr:hypothetical protein PLESTM_001411300 [Pleodorina starrii]GLC49706.1 hypothetical protein PLESTB_000278000 [Pleodorina starrii]GLC76006.1 hypothetical protein PLESTF_001719800 [Pleodorina starrii]